MNVLQYTNRGKLVASLFPKSDDKECQDISQIAKDIVQEKGNLEAHEVLMIRDREQSSRVTITQLQDTRIANGPYFWEPVTKLRIKFSRTS